MLNKLERGVEIDLERREEGESVNVDLMSLYVHQIYRPRHYSPLAQVHRIGLKGSRPCLMVYVQGMWSAP